MYLWEAYCALETLLNYVNTRSVVFSTELAKAPGLSEKVYSSAREAAENASSGDFYMGWLNAAIAGWCVVDIIYFSSGNRES